MLSVYNEKYKQIENAIKYFQYNNISIMKCASMFDIHRETLTKYLKQYDLHENRSAYKVDEDFFEYIDCETKAYWLGFIVADGCLKGNNQLSIRLSIKDIDHLEKFKESIKSNHKINIETSVIRDKEYKTCVLRINNTRLYKDLLKLNVEPNKSLNERPAIIPPQFISHYIRGIFDGDGWLSWNHNCAEIGLGMGYDILNYIKECAESYANIKSYEVKPYKKIYRYRITSKIEIMKILNYIYKDSNIYLNRKYEKYLEFCRLESKSQKAQEY